MLKCFKCKEGLPKASLLLVCALVLLMCASCASGGKPDGTAIRAHISGEAITQNELDYFEARLRTSIISACVSEYGVTYSSDFWDTPLGGSTPAERLAEASFKECVRAKAQLLLFRENGIYENISYEALREKAVAFNNSSSGQSGVVGLTSIELDSFYTYYIDNGALEYKNTMREKAPELSARELDEKYNALIDEMIANAEITQAETK